MTEAVQTLRDRDPRPTETLETSVKADTAEIQARRALDRWLARER